MIKATSPDSAAQGADGPAGAPGRLLSQRVRKIKISPTIAIAEQAAALRAAGRDVIGLSVGEPDFATPDNVIEAAHGAARDGYTRYTAPDGAHLVKSAVREKLRRDNDLDYETTEIIVASGSKQIIYNAMGATVEQGDEVVIFAPYWVSYADMIDYCGGRPVIVQTAQERGFKPDPAALAAALTPRTKWIFLNSPNNPTGAVYPPALLQEIAEVVRRHDTAMVLSDEIYEQLIYDGTPHVSIANVAPDLRDRILVVNGVSKTYAMTGWRSGFGAGPAWLISAMAKVQSQTTGSSSSIGQAAAAAAMTGDQAVVAERRARMKTRRDLVMEGLKGTNRLSVPRPDGAFYVFADVSRCIDATAGDGRILKTDQDVAAYLLDAADVATVPGEAFGASPYVRLSFALDESKIDTACRRIVEACNRLEGPASRPTAQPAEAPHAGTRS